MKSAMCGGILCIAVLAMQMPQVCAQSPGLQSRDRTLPPAPNAVMVNHRSYQPPTQRQLFRSYLRDTYGAWGWTATTVRATYAFGRDKPSEWGQDAAGYGQRFGSSFAVTSINGTVRYGMEELFHEDLRYIPCHGCTVKHKIENALLSEITARHESDGHRVFSLTPTISDFSGPILVHQAWYPGTSSGPMSGVVSARLVFATNIGTRLFREFVLERKHYDEPE